MAEVVGVLGLIASILGILEGIDKSKTIFKKYVHSSSSLRAELVPLLGKLTAFAGLLRGLQLECELDESDNGRLQVFAHIREPLEHSKRAAQTIVARLNQVISVGGISLSFGKILNKESAAALHMLDETKSVLDLALTADQRTLLKSIETYLRNVTEDVNAIREENRVHYHDLKDDLLSIKADKAETSKRQEKAKLLNWVSQVNYSSNFHASLSPTLEDDASGAWFINGKPFQDWKLNLDSRGLLLTGISGAGKTVLCSKAIRNLLQDDTISLHSPIIAYFFFDFNDVAKQSVEGMVRSLIFQLTAQLDQIPDELQTLYSDYRSNTFASPVPPLQDWYNILKSCLRSAKTSYIFIDALDECEEEEGRLLSDTLEVLFRDTPVGIKWFLSCRPSQRAITMLQAAGFVHSSMGTEVVDSDIRHYLCTKLEKDPRLKSFGSLAKDLIVSQISSKSSGMRLRKVETVLETMPGDISSIYKRVLIDLQKSEDWLIVERVLTLVSYSARPVTLAEVTEFAILEDDMTTIRPNERFEDFSEIISLIGSLVNVQDGNLILAHKSVQDFMVTLQVEGECQSPGSTNLLYRGADGYIAKRCLQYLGFPQQPARDIAQAPNVKDPNSRQLAKLLVQYPFLDYAASRWPHHVRTRELQFQSAEQMRLILPFTVKPNLWNAWLMLQRVDIWETQLQLARLLCEALIRSIQVPAWSYGFWQARQNYRVITRLKKPSLMSWEGKSNEDVSGLPSWFRSFIVDCEASLCGVDNFAFEMHSDFYVKARCDYATAFQHELAFLAGDRILVVGEQDANTWKGTLHRRTGLFPAEFVIREQPEASKNITGEIYYELAAILLEVALQTSLSLDLKQLLAKVTSERSLEILLVRWEVLISRAANILGSRYGSVVREALSNVKYAQGLDSDLYEKQDYAMDKLHSPLQHMLESGFRASRSPVTGSSGHRSSVERGKKLASSRAIVRNWKGGVHIQQFGPAQVRSQTYGPARYIGTYGISRAAYEAGRFSAPMYRKFDDEMTQGYNERSSDTAASGVIPYGALLRPNFSPHEIPYSVEYRSAKYGTSSTPDPDEHVEADTEILDKPYDSYSPRSHGRRSRYPTWLEKRAANSSVLKTVTEVPPGDSRGPDETKRVIRDLDFPVALRSILQKPGRYHTTATAMKKLPSLDHGTFIDDSDAEAPTAPAAMQAADEGEAAAATTEEADTLQSLGNMRREAALRRPRYSPPPPPTLELQLYLGKRHLSNRIRGGEF